MVELLEKKNQEILRKLITGRKKLLINYSIKESFDKKISTQCKRYQYIENFR